MTSWTILARAGTASGDDIILRQRGEVFEICYKGIELMSNLNHQSEDQLALRSMRRMNFEARRILIGGWVWALRCARCLTLPHPMPK